MKTIVVFAALLVVAFAFPQKRQTQEGEREVVLVRHTPSNYVGGDNYKFGYELSDGQMREEDAQIEMQDSEKSVLRVRGSYAWYNPENGMTYQINYIADENGFQPQGAHLPVAPAAPVVPAVPVAAVLPVVQSAPVVPEAVPSSPVVPEIATDSVVSVLPDIATDPAVLVLADVATDPGASVLAESCH